MHICEANGCVVLARKQTERFTDVYGECRDSELMRSICEPVGMAHCLHKPCTSIFYAAMAELADAADLGSVGIPVQVQVLLAALFLHKKEAFMTPLFYVTKLLSGQFHIISHGFFSS